MNPSESGFITGMFILVFVSAVLKWGGLILFNLTLRPEDDEKLERAKTGKPLEQLAAHSILWGCISFIGHCSFFFNSAILVAIFIKRNIL